MSKLSKALDRRVRIRARTRCEYCHLPEWVDAIPFQIDHVIAKQHLGRTRIGNLALSCAFCNAHKGTNLAGIDPLSGRIVALFNPRQNRWETHFRWVGPRLVGLTPAARATIVVLAINDPVNVAVRRSLMAEGAFDKRQ